jgi:hypothetical protein
MSFKYISMFLTLAGVDSRVAGFERGHDLSKFTLRASLVSLQEPGGLAEVYTRRIKEAYQGQKR